MCSLVMTSADFTLPGYRDLLEALAQRGYTASAFIDYGANDRNLFLRHDLDMSVDAAIPVAEIESGLGITATYFIMLRDEYYNPYAPRSLRALYQLINLGHHIGLHLDAYVYDNDLGNIDEAVERECAILESILGRPVKVVSFHRPSEALQGLDRPVGGRHHAYEPRFFQDIGYCTDSRGSWGYGHPMEHDAVREGSNFQLLTHPVWWDAGFGETVRERLDRLALRRFDLFRAELARNCGSYPQELMKLDPSGGKRIHLPEGRCAATFRGGNNERRS